MKIIYIDPQSYSNLALYDYNLLSNINNINIIFVGNKLYDLKIPNNIDFIPLFSYSKKKNILFKLLSYLKSLFNLCLIIKRENPDIVHVQWIKFFFFDYIVLVYIKLLNIKYVYTAHNVVPHNSGNKDNYKYKIFYNTVDAIIVHTESTKQEIVSTFDILPDKICIIPHGILTYGIDEALIDQKIECIRNDLKLENQLVFLSMGVQSEYKGSDIICKVWMNNFFLQDKNKYHLFIVGKCDQIDYKKIKAIDNVTVVDRFVSDVEFQAFLRVGDVLLLPYRKISQSGVLLTAISTHTPFLVSNCGGLSEPLKIANVGWNIGQATFENLSHILRDGCITKEIVMRIKSDENSWRLLENYYSWESLAKKTRIFYDEICN